MNAQPDPKRPAPNLDPAPLPMIEVTGPGHRVRLVNDAFCQLVGEEREALIGRPFVELVANRENCTSLLDGVYGTGRSTAQAPAGATGDAPAAWILAMWPARDAGASPVGVVIQMTRVEDPRRDIAEMNEALLLGALRQHELREASDAANARLETAVAERTAQLRDSVAQLEAFSYSLAHDLRAPVRAIQGFVHLALELPGAEAWDGTGLLQRVVAAAARMEELIQDVLNLNRVASRPMTLSPMDVEAMVREIIAEHPELGPEQADLQVDAPLPAMLGHATTFRQCVTNLLDNAVKFVAAGERPRIRVRAERRAARLAMVQGVSTGAASEAEARRARNANEQGTVRLWVEDEGIGIAAEHREKIFEIFERLPPAARYAGTGIGLAIVQKAIRRMGGSVGVEPGEPRGSRFWLELAAG